MATLRIPLPTIKVHFDAPRGNGPDGNGLSKEMNMAHVPREGDAVHIESHMYRVHDVSWYVDDGYVYIVLRG